MVGQKVSTAWARQMSERSSPFRCMGGWCISQSQSCCLQVYNAICLKHPHSNNPRSGSRACAIDGHYIKQLTYSSVSVLSPTSWCSSRLHGQVIPHTYSFKYKHGSSRSYHTQCITICIRHYTTPTRTLMPTVHATSVLWQYCLAVNCCWWVISHLMQQS